MSLHAPRFNGRGIVSLVPALLLVSLSPLVATGQGIIFSERPANLQLYGRDQQDAAQVVFAGQVTAAGHDSVRFELDRAGALISVQRAGLTYTNGAAAFRLQSPIHAELAEYTARFYLDDGLACERDSLVCGDVYLINGQSNAVAGGQGTATVRSEWLRSFGTSNADPGFCAADTAWGLAQGSVSYTHTAIGVWGLYLGLSLVEGARLPVAILNGAVGGTLILWHERNDADPVDLNTIYGRLLWRDRHAGVAGDVRALLWHQGESDAAYDTWTLYDTRFGSLWNAWHQDYGPLSRVYGFQIRPGCGGAYQAQIRDVQRRLPAEFPSLTYMSTAGVDGHDGCHFSDAGYRQMAGWIYPFVARDFYGAVDTLGVRPPAVESAFYRNAQHTELCVQFDTEVVWSADTLSVPMKDYVFLDGNWRQVASGRVGEDARTLILTLNAPSSATRLGYVPNFQYWGPPWSCYEGPWLRNPRGVGAFTFWDFPISDLSGVAAGAADSGVLTIAPNPIAGSTRIRFSLSTPGAMRLEVFDVGGRRLRRLSDGWFPAGVQTAVWDGLDAGGERVPAGIYLLRLQAGNEVRQEKLTLVR